MKLLVFIICFTALGALASSTYSQGIKLTLDVNNSAIKKVLLEIEDKSEFYFLYNNELIDVEKKVDIEVKGKNISVILDKLFEGQEVDFSIMDRQIVISPKDINSTTSSPQAQVTGTVSDEFGEPMPGVTVLIKGTTTGAITDVDGNYVVPATSDDILTFSFIGMRTKEIAVGNQSKIDITMEVDAIGIEEVVAIGYGVSKKSDLTGSVVKVNIEELAELPNVSVIQNMRGTVAGLNVGATDGVGQNPSLSIRGQNSLSSSASANAPLIVVDGSIYRGSLIDLNTADIESVDILKDASSAAIYGSQASNGVMIITTKKGVDLGKPIVSYSGSYTIQSPSNQLTPMKADEAEVFFGHNLWLESRLAPDYLQPNSTYNIAQNFKTTEITNGYNAGLDEDWWGGLTGNGGINTHNISLRGKGKSLDYFISGGYTGVEGFVQNDDYKKYSYRANMNAQINDWMKIGFESFLTSSDYSGAAPSASTAFLLQPWAPIKDDNGELVLFPEGSMLNPYATLNLEDSDKRMNIFANFHADIKLPLKGLNYRINFSQNYRTSNHDQYNPYGANQVGSGYKNSGIGYDWTVDNILSFNRTFNDIHNVSATLVYGVEKRIGSNTNSSAQNFVNGSLGYNRLQAGDPTLNSISTGAWQETSLYTMGRIMYNLNNKYLITGTVRRDGFSGFGSEEKIGVFPSAALGWVASEESFLKDNVEWLNYLKLRGSYGSTGRRAVGRYQTMAKLSSGPSQVFGDGGATTFGQYISSMANNELGWETTTGINLGIDFSVLDSRIFGNIEYYSNDTEDILYNIQLPTLTGFSSIATNIGKVHNNGLEFSLTGLIVKSRDLNWEATLNYSRNRNEIVSILGFDNDGDGIEDDLVANRLFIGEPQQVIYDYAIVGMWQLADQEAGIIPSGFFPGTYKLEDVSGPDGEPDGVISSAYDKKILGYRDPAYRFSIANRVNYKNFSLYVLINSIQGGKDHYLGDDDPYSGTWRHKEQKTYVNAPAGSWDYWMPENPNAKYRRLDTPSSYQGYHYNQRNFVRLQDVSLSYTFDKSLINKADMGSLKLYVSAQNLVTITKWKGWDPETGRGFDPGVPLMRNFTFGLNVEF
ncbi:MAG: TonB-dependent receptor [Bacteroidota bacterium]